MGGLLEENGNTEWLYENGSIAVLNNGINLPVLISLCCSLYFLLVLDALPA
jgi:hypothetical protein